MTGVETLKELELHPIDELIIAEEKFLEAASLGVPAQADLFAERIIFDLTEDGLRIINKIREDFEKALSNHWGGSLSSSPLQKVSTRSSIAEEEPSGRKRSVMERVWSKATSAQGQDETLPIASTAFTWFLEKTKKPMAQVHRRSAFHGVITEDGRITLLGYLMYHFRRRIIYHHYQRQGRKVSKSLFGLQCGQELGNEEFGYELKLSGERKKVAEVLKEEFFLRYPINVDKVLDAGMRQFNQIVAPLRRTIHEITNLVDDEELSPVKRSAAKAEMVAVKKQYAEAYQMSWLKLNSRIEKVKKQQHEKYQDLKTKVVGKIKYRQMTMVRITNP